MEVSQFIFYFFAFVATYIQVFFLYTFFDKKYSIKKHTKVSLKSYPAVTVLVPCWNEEDSVVSTVKSLLNLEYPQSKLFITLIDDGSTDSTWDVMQKYSKHSQITLLKKENGGKHTALNMGIEHTSTGFICSFDADTTVVPDALKQAMQYFHNDAELMALGGTVLISKPKTIIQKAQSVEYQMFSFSKKMLGLLNGVLVVPGAFSLFKKEALLEVGGYNSGHNLEDLELTYRMQMAGLKVNQCDTAFVYTDGPVTPKQLFKQRLRWSYGFINNCFDYRKVLFNKKYGNFGMFTVPMSLLAYVIILYVFFISWVRIIQFLGDKLFVIKTLGFASLIPASFDMFFVNTSAIMFLTLVSYSAIFLTIYLGKRLTHSELGIRSLFWFMAVYSVMVPLWVLASLYNSIFIRKGVAWR
ncbi:MAG: cellulose synthase/poly-beta-1,6-N-acetylglucosamine synthase-like glycosyltransferase [Flavobacteriaceae bacterium]|jgi:cellulose synthase/poly-beta-1,6-N-acetylglucosamine synthase-like glycosyltransferase